MRVDLLSQLVKQESAKFPKKASVATVNGGKHNAMKDFHQQLLRLSGSLFPFNPVWASYGIFLGYSYSYLDLAVLVLVLCLGLDSSLSTEYE